MCSRPFATEFLDDTVGDVVDRERSYHLYSEGTGIANGLGGVDVGAGLGMDTAHRAAHPGYYMFARDVIASQGLGPGFPQQFAYVEAAHDHPSHVTRDKIAIRVGGETGILQGATREPIVGQYRSMVEDIPFDPVYEANQARYMHVFGFASIVMAVLLMGM